MVSLHSEQKRQAKEKIKGQAKIKGEKIRVLLEIHNRIERKMGNNGQKIMQKNVNGEKTV